MSNHDNFRPLPSLDLRRVFTSLGLPITAFRDAGTKKDKILIDTALNADASRPNGLWLFQGSNYYLYNLETGEIEDGPRPIAGNFAGETLPEMFKSKIHAAAWGGPAFPHFWYLFKDELYIGITSEGVAGSGDADFVLERLWKRFEGWRGILGAWATGVWANPDGTWKTPGVPVALHGLGSKFHGMMHFFKDGQYVRHNLNTGGTDAGPVPIKDVWNLPDEFLNQIDLCFYGTGQNEENIYFISGPRYVLYDFRQNAVIDSGFVEKKFPAFAQFFGRPQLFLVEDYTLETFIGPPHLGRLIDTKSIGAGQKITKILVTQTNDTSKTTLSKSLLESQESSVVQNFYDKLDKNTSSSEGSESYRYQLNADFHGEAEATSVWGGEVDATLNVKGGSDTARSAFGQATFKSIQSQVDDAKRDTEQRTYNSESEITQQVNFLKKEIFEETNSSDKIRVYEFYEQLQPYVALLVLRHVHVGYSDGMDPPRVVELQALPSLLNDVLVDPSQQMQLMGYLRGELANVADHEGKPRSLIDVANPLADLVLASNLTSTYQIQKIDGTAQAISVRGLIKADKAWIAPTYTITPVQRDNN